MNFSPNPVKKRGAQRKIKVVKMDGSLEDFNPSKIE